MENNEYSVKQSSRSIFSFRNISLKRVLFFIIPFGIFGLHDFLLKKYFKGFIHILLLIIAIALLVPNSLFFYVLAFILLIINIVFTIYELYARNNIVEESKFVFKLFNCFCVISVLLAVLAFGIFLFLFFNNNGYFMNWAVVLDFFIKLLYTSGLVYIFSFIYLSVGVGIYNKWMFTDIKCSRVIEICTRLTCLFALLPFIFFIFYFILG